MSRGILKLFSICFLLTSVFAVDELNYTFIKKQNNYIKDSNNTLLVFGGIQGDEPGGFLAASLLSTEYNITKGSVWIVPNLNFPSIIKRSRGIHGDMNRKFSTIDGKDPDYSTVANVKSLITDPQVALIVNLHDGSGFYREKYIDKYFNPNRWGNSCIIDQVSIKAQKYGDLQKIAQSVADEINTKLKDKKHKYHVKNTKTKEGDVEMLKSLTFYAIEHAKPAFANEASKSLALPNRVYYHLVALEKYMQIMGIEFTRNFTLSPQGIKDAINKGIEVSLYGNKVYLNLENPRSVIKYVPMPKQVPLDYTASNPLTAVVKDGKSYNIHYGNRKLTKLVPQYFEYTPEVEEIYVIVDGQKKLVPLGSLIKVEDYFEVLPIQNQRVNVIGYTNKKYKNEVNIAIKKKNMIKSYSIDKTSNMYRVEIYDMKESKKGTYAGMFLVEFTSTDKKQKR